MKTKRCVVCGQEKGPDYFNRDRSNKDGRQSVCRACYKIRRDAIRKKNGGLEQV